MSGAMDQSLPYGSTWGALNVAQPGMSNNLPFTAPENMFPPEMRAPSDLRVNDFFPPIRRLISRALLNALTLEEQSVLDMLLPIILVPPNTTVQMVSVTYTTGMLSPTPPTAVTDIQTFQQTAVQWKMAHFGAGAQLYTPNLLTQEGKDHLFAMMQVFRVRAQYQRNNEVFRAILGSQGGIDIMKIYAQLGPNPNLEDIEGFNMSVWGAFNKDPFCFQPMMMAAISVLEQRGVSGPFACVLPAGQMIGMQTDPVLTAYKQTGQEGVNSFTGAKSNLFLGGKLKVCDAPRLPVDSESTEFQDMLVMLRQIGGFVPGRSHVTMPRKEWKKYKQQVTIYDEAQAQWADISLQLWILWSRLFDPVTGEPSEAIGQPFWSRFVSVADWLHKTGALEDLVNHLGPDLPEMARKFVAFAGTQEDVVIESEERDFDRNRNAGTRRRDGTHLNVRTLGGKTAVKTSDNTGDVVEARFMFGQGFEGNLTAVQMQKALSKIGRELRAKESVREQELGLALLQASVAMGRAPTDAYIPYMDASYNHMDDIARLITNATDDAIDGDTSEKIAEYVASLEESYPELIMALRMSAKQHQQALQVARELENSAKPTRYGLAFLRALLPNEPVVVGTAGAMYNKGVRYAVDPAKSQAAGEKPLDADELKAERKYALGLTEEVPMFTKDPGVLSGIYATLVDSGVKRITVRDWIDREFRPLFTTLGKYLTRKASRKQEDFISDELKQAIDQIIRFVLSGRTAKFLRKVRELEVTTGASAVIPLALDQNNEDVLLRILERIKVLEKDGHTPNDGITQSDAQENVGLPALADNYGYSQAGHAHDFVEALSALHMNRDTFDFFIANRVPIPMTFLLVRNGQTYRMGSTIVMKTGLDTGAVLMSPAFMSSGENAARLITTVSFRTEMGAIVNKPQNIYIIPNTHGMGYVKGNDTTFYDLLDPATVQNCKDGHFEYSIIVIPLHYNEDTPSLRKFDLMGRGPFGVPSADQHKGLPFSMCPVIRDLLGFKQEEKQTYFDIHMGSAQPKETNTRCFEDAYYDAMGVYHEGNAYWGPHVYPQVKYHRTQRIQPQNGGRFRNGV